MIRRTVVGLFAQTLFLLLLYTAVALLDAVRLLNSDLPPRLPELADLLAQLTIVTGTLGGGVYIAFEDRLDGAHRPLRVAFYAWSVVLVVTLTLGVVMTVPPLLTLIRYIVILAFAGLVAQGIRTWDAVPRVWLVGLAVLLVDDLRLTIAYPLLALTMTFWLMQRFSHVRYAWANFGLYNLAIQLTVAGLLLTFAERGVAIAGTIGAILTPLVYVIFASHSYRALSDRNHTRTLAAHWVALSVLLFLLGTGTLGALHAPAPIRQWIDDTHLTDLRDSLITLALIAVILGMINYITAEIRAENRRITGLMPFWLVVFGTLGGSIALFGAGLVQVYAPQADLSAIYVFWVGGWISIAWGVLFYVLGFWARRP